MLQQEKDNAMDVLIRKMKKKTKTICLPYLLWNVFGMIFYMGRYLPGYKDGGPVRSIKNLTDFLGKEYNFKILTCDRDHGDTEAYPNIKVNGCLNNIHL